MQGLMKSRIFIYSLIFVGLLTSCDSWINVDQPDVIEQEQAFDDPNSARLSMIGLYGLMADMVEPLFLAGEVRADLTIATKSAETFIKEYSNNSFSASNPYISPKPFYTLINNANDFIYEFENLLENQQIDSTDFLKYKSELVGLRVWSQFQIARTFGNCKYYTERLTADDKPTIKDLPYGNNLLGKLIADLTFSDTIIFTSQSEDLVWQSIRFTDYFINNLMGEIYLDMGDYDNAYDKFDEVTKRGDLYNRKPAAKFSINEDFYGMEWMDELFAKDWEPTSIINHAVFMIAYDNKYNQTNELWNWTSSLDYQLAPADWYVEEFYKNAITDAGVFNRDYRVYSILNRDENLDREYSITKYPEDDRPFIVSRTARVELLKAFCLNAQGRGRTAIGRIDRVRGRLNLPDLDDSEMPDDEEAVIWLEDIIMKELAYETGFEGQRWYDLMRVANRRNDPSYLAEQVAQKYPEESREDILEKLKDEANWFIPVFE